MTPSAEPTRHSFILHSHLSETSRARELVLPFALEAGFSEERCFDIQVASSEACANAIEHSPEASEVEFSVLVYPDRVEIQVEGRGEFELPAAAARERVHRGLGLPLMAKLSDHLSLYSGPRGGTLVALTFYRPGFRDREESDDVTPPWIREVIEENELVAAITSAVPVGLYVTDPELRIRWANAAFLEFLEEPYCSQPLEGVFIGDAVPGSEKAGSLEIIRAVSRTGERAFFPEFEYVGFARGATYWRWELLPLKQDRREPPYDVLTVISEITEQVLQRKKVESASRSYQALAENSGLGLALCRTICDPEGKAVDFEFVEVNRLHRAFTGLPPEEVVGRKVSEVIPGFPQELIEVQNQVSLSGEPREEEIYEPHLSRWYRLNLYSPEPGYFVSLFTDITADKAAGLERDRAEEALRESEERFRSIFASNVVALALWHTDGRLLEANDCSLELIGYSRSELEAGEVRWVEATPPELRQRDQQAVEALLAGVEIEPYEKEFVRPDGSRVAVLIGGSMLPGSAEIGVAFAINITERKETEDALRQSEERYRTLFNTMAEAFALVDLVRDEKGKVVDERFLDVNPSWERMAAIAREDAIGSTGRELFGVVEDHWLEMFDRVVKTAQPGHLEAHGAGRGREHSVTAWKAGEDRLAQTFTDVTERK